MDSIESISENIWKELVEASCVEPPHAKPFYDDMVKKEDPSNSKVLFDLKKPTVMSSDEYKSIPAKNNWNGNIKFSLFSINKLSADEPIRLCHLLLYTAHQLKIFGDDAFGKVSACCNVGASVVNHLLEQNHVFSPAGSGRYHPPVCVHPLNDETFKAVVVDLLKCTSNDIT
jgi:hypothetical protein